MKLRGLPKLMFIMLLAASAGTPQSRPYIKFGHEGEPIGLYGLLNDPAACGKLRFFTGKLVSVRTRASDRETAYKFSIRFGSITRTFRFVLEKDEVPTRKLSRLIARGRTVKVRICERGTSADAIDEVARVP